ncbi:MAG: FRG domain-containing protein [Phycisphaerales bacterium]
MDSKWRSQIEQATNWEQTQLFFKKRADEQDPTKEAVKWIYRGQSYHWDKTVPITEVAPGLETSLERAFVDFEVRNEARPRWEKDIIRDFRRKLPLYMSNTPGRYDILGWLALMQHHHAPTRLQDWTYSPWVALHFAVNRLRPEQVGEVWALDAKWFTEKTESIFGLCGEWRDGMLAWQEKIRLGADALYMDDGAVKDNAKIMQLIESPKALIYNVNPFRLNERLTIQHGVFLVPGDMTLSFMQNLESSTYGNDLYERIHILRIGHEHRKDILRELRRMNINNAVLFPGLDGFAESLWTRLAVPFHDLRSAYPDSM